MNRQEQFGWTIEQGRYERALSLAELSELTGISRAHLSEVERGLKNISFEYACRLAGVLEFSLDAFVDREEIHMDTCTLCGRALRDDEGHMRPAGAFPSEHVPVCSDCLPAFEAGHDIPESCGSGQCMEDVGS